MDEHENEVMRWWKTARQEVCCMASAVPALFADLGSPLAPVLFATDAQGASDADAGGCGIVGRDVDESLGRQVFEVCRKPGYSVTPLSGEFTGLRRPQEVIARRVPFSRLPPQLLDPTRLMLPGSRSSADAGALRTTLRWVNRGQWYVW